MPLPIRSGKELWKRAHTLLIKGDEDSSSHASKKLNLQQALLAKRVPYQTSLRHGFLLKSSTTFRNDIIHVFHHWRMVVNDQGKVLINNESSGDNFTFGAIDRTSQIGVWDTGKPRHTFKLDGILTQVCLIEKFGVYAGCSNESWIKILNNRFEAVGIRPAPHAVQLVRYNKANSDQPELIAIGFHDITIWSLQGHMKRGEIRVELTLKQHYQTGIILCFI